MQRVNLHEAKTHLSRLVAQAVAGEGFVICKAGVPLVQVTLLAGQCSIPDDFDRIASEEIADLFAGSCASEPGRPSAIQGDGR
jgi:antitoxin (DNA-binding transcriptional repressor) of toxin-antitoxin stability system